MINESAAVENPLAARVGTGTVVVDIGFSGRVSLPNPLSPSPFSTILGTDGAVGSASGVRGALEQLSAIRNRSSVWNSLQTHARCMRANRSSPQ